VLSFIQFRAQKLLLSIVILNLHLNVKYFQQNYMLTKCLCHENLELFFRVAPKRICGPLILSTKRCLSLGWKVLTDSSWK